MALLEAAGRSSGPEEHRLRAASVAEEIVVWRLNAKSILDFANVDWAKIIPSLRLNLNWQTCSRLNFNVEATSKPLASCFYIELQCRPRSILTKI